MLTEKENKEVFVEIQKKNKEVMKDILELAGQGLDDTRFQRFKKNVFNYFGVSGLETEIRKILDSKTEGKNGK